MPELYDKYCDWERGIITLSAHNSHEIACDRDATCIELRSPLMNVIVYEPCRAHNRSLYGMDDKVDNVPVVCWLLWWRWTTQVKIRVIANIMKWKSLMIHHHIIHTILFTYKYVVFLWKITSVSINEDLNTHQLLKQQSRQQKTTRRPCTTESRCFQMIQ
jgi:hypothetical protein